MKLYLAKFNENFYSVLEDGILFNNISKLQNECIAIKPNLTFPIFRKGVMTGTDTIEMVVKYLKQFTNNIVICESDSGGYNRFSISEVFAGVGLDKIAKKYDIKLVNMSYEPSKNISVSVGNRNIDVPLPILLLEETDLFITMPVPKIHMNTGVTLSLKNQWGVIQEPSVRLKLHPYFKEVIYAVNKALPKSISIVDGKFGLTGSGPMAGEVLDLNWFVMGDDLFATDFVLTKMMGLDYRKISYLKYIFDKEGISDIKDIKLNTDIEPFVRNDFYLKRKLTDWPGYLAFNSSALAYLAYHSPLSDILHKLLYLFRKPFYDYDDPSKTSEGQN